MTTICLLFFLFFAPLPAPIPIPLWSPPLCMARSALMLKDDLVGCFFPPRRPQQDLRHYRLSHLCTSSLQNVSLTVSCRRFGERWRSERGELTRLPACLSPIRGCLFSGVSLSLRFRAPADLPHGLPEWATCWNTRSADLHLPGLVETAWYEWNSLAQDILLRNMSTWIHFPAQKGSSAALPHSWGTGMQGEDDSLRLCAFVPRLIGSSSSPLLQKKEKEKKRKRVYRLFGRDILFLNAADGSFSASLDPGTTLMRTNTRDKGETLAFYCRGSFSRDFQLIFNYESWSFHLRPGCILIACNVILSHALWWFNISVWVQSSLTGKKSAFTFLLHRISETA